MFVGAENMRSAIFLVTAPLFLFAASSANAQSRQFFCGDGSHVNVTVIDDQTVRAEPIDGEAMMLRASPGEKWHFLKGDYGVRISPDQSRLDLEIPDFGVKKCIYQTVNVTSPGGTALPHAATSWGGKVRSGPGTDYKDIGTLSEGERITILEQASAPFFQNRPWFKIRFRGRTGYHWGGIICPLGEAISGTYQVCDAEDAEQPATAPRKKSAKKLKRKSKDGRTFSKRCRDNREGCNIGVKEACRNLARWGC